MSLLERLSLCPEVIGLDIGSAAIKVVQLRQGRSGIVLHKAGSAPTPVGTMRGGIIADPQVVSQAIRELLEALGVEAAAAVAGVSGPTVVVRQVQLPAMSERALRKSVSWEARNYISFPVEDSVLECQILKGAPKNGGQMEVMLVAVPREMVDSQVQTIEMAGLEPLAVEIQAFSTMRSLVEWQSGLNAIHQTIALMGIGATHTDISIVNEGGFVLSRSIPIAGNGFTEAIRAALDIPTEEANLLKETGMRVVCSEEERAGLDPAAQQASRAVEPLLDELVREVRRSLAYHDYSQKVPEGASEAGGVHRILLSGGGARLADIGSYLSAQLRVPVDMPDIFANGYVQLPGVDAQYLRDEGPSLVVSTGLALRELMLGGRRRRNTVGNGN